MSELRTQAIVRDKIVALSNKPLVINADKLTIYITQNNFTSAADTIKSLKSDIKEIEELLKKLQS